jgi:glycosyltransferase involved in cell wall biosynthesis
MRILFVADLLPYPTVDHSGGTDLFHYIEWLSQRHEVSLISFAGPGEMEQANVMREYCADVEVISSARTLGSKVRRVPLLLRYPQRLVRYQSKEFGRRLAMLLRKRTFDIIHAERIWMAHHLRQGSIETLLNPTEPPNRSMERPRLVLDEVDVYSSVAKQRYLGSKTPWGRAFHYTEWLRSRAYEASLYPHADLILTRSDKDRQDILARHAGLSVKVLPPWFEGLGELSTLDTPPSEPHSLLFLGTMRAWRNYSAVQYFHQEIWPLVRHQVPDASFYIVGSKPPESIRQLDHEPGIHVLGYVEDLVPRFAHCSVFVAPLLTAGGIIVKILNAMAAGRPVVTTTLGNQGIGALPERDIRIADSPGEFARKTVELLSDRSLWQRISENGRSFVRRNFDWEQAMRSVEDAYLDLLSGKTDMSQQEASATGGSAETDPARLHD